MRETLRPSLTFAIALCLLVRTEGAQAGVLMPAGPEFDPSQNGPSIQSIGQAVERFADGRFVVAWVQNMGGSTNPVRARVFEASGVPASPEVVIGETHNRIDLTIVPPGDRFIFTGSTASLPSTWRLFDDSLTALGPEIPISVQPPANLVFAYGTIIDSDGHVEVLSQHSRDTHPRYGRLQINRFLIDGTSLGAPTVVEETSTGDKGQWPLGMVATSDGNVAVAWAHFDFDVSQYHQYGDPAYSTGWIRRYDASGAIVGSDFSFTGGVLEGEGELYGIVAADNAGHIVVAGSLSTQFGASTPPLLKRFALDGSGELDLPHDSRAWALDASSGGHVVAAFGQSSPDAPSGRIQRYGPDGSVDGPAIPIADDLIPYGFPDAVSINAEGSVIAAFELRVYGTGTRVRRFCDSSDASCRRCPEYADGVDNDGDGLPDGCDPCNVLDSGQVSPAAETYVTYGGTSVPSPDFSPIRNNVIKLGQQFHLPPGVAFGDIPVEADGFRLRLETVAGAAMTDFVVPGGAYAGRGTAGWYRKGSKYIFLDRMGTSANGVRRIMISDRGSTEPGLLSVNIKAAAGSYAVGETYLPIKSILVLGNVSSAMAGLCSETDYSAEDCIYEQGSNGRIRCVVR